MEQRMAKNGGLLWGLGVWAAIVAVAATAEGAEPSAADSDAVEAIAVGAAADSSADSTSTPTSGRRIRYTVERGDTLSEIAREHGCSVDDLREWNDLDGDFLRTGQTLVIRSSRSRGSRSREASTSEERRSSGSYRLAYIVERGDTLSEIAHDHSVTVDDLVRWNRGINPELIRAGQEIRIYLDDRPGRSASVGRPNRGRISVSQQLPEGPGYRVRNPSRSYGTNETVSALEGIFAGLHQHFPDAPDIAIGDLSYETGGRMRPHASHQSGRDADIAYFTVGREDDDGFILATPENLDVRRTWYLLKSLIDTDAVMYLFVDYDLQGVLYDYARRRGASPEELESWFQYPRGDSADALIRHTRGHDDHFHVRFRCSSADRRCREQ